VDHEIVLPCLAAIGRLLPTAVISAWLGLTSASNRCANSGVSRHIRQVRSLKLIR
jgi:hypothetical protein